MLYNLTLLFLSLTLLLLSCRGELTLQEIHKHLCYAKVEERKSPLGYGEIDDGDTPRHYTLGGVLLVTRRNLDNSNLNLLKKDDLIFRIDNCSTADILFLSSIYIDNFGGQGYQSKLDIFLDAREQKELVGKVHRVWIIRNNHESLILINENGNKIIDPCDTNCSSFLY
ncbi:MAG: hypothetical protein KBF93_11540 [Leptospiraceae bacterium]|nr:hypothetical protein [Leptospiraceae bacterium]